MPDDKTIPNYKSFGSSFALRDINREPHPTPCPDCGRTYLNGENVTWHVPVVEPNDHRVVWSGCCDCWVKHTNPSGTLERSDDA